MTTLIPLVPFCLGALVFARLVGHVVRSRFTSQLSVLVRPASAIVACGLFAGSGALYAFVVEPAVHTLSTVELAAGEVDATGATVVFATIVSSVMALVFVAVAGRTQLLVIDRGGRVCFGRVIAPWPLAVIEHVDRIGPLRLARKGGGNERVDLWGSRELVQLSHDSYNGSPMTTGEYSERTLRLLVREVNEYLEAFRAHDTDERRAQRLPTRDATATRVAKRGRVVALAADAERQRTTMSKTREAERAEAKEHRKRTARAQKLASKLGR
jgi:hypothetical protein